MVGCDDCHRHASCVGHHERLILLETVNPLFLHSQHMYDEVCRRFGAIDGAVRPALGQVGIMIRMGVTDESAHPEAETLPGAIHDLVITLAWTLTTTSTQSLSV